MSFGSGWSSSARNCVVAVGVSDMAAFRGRSLLCRFGGFCAAEGFGGVDGGRDFWASNSGMLILVRGLGSVAAPIPSSGIWLGILVSLIR